MNKTTDYDLYTSDIQEAIAIFFDDKPVLGAMFAAASKRHISNVVLDMISMIDADMTPILANKIMKATWGRSVSMTKLVSRFATKGRTAHDKSADFQYIDKLIAKHKEPIIKAVKLEKVHLLAIRKSLIASENIKQ